jgi:hypothetical protein
MQGIGPLCSYKTETPQLRILFYQKQSLIKDYASKMSLIPSQNDTNTTMKFLDFIDSGM